MNSKIFSLKVAKLNTLFSFNRQEEIQKFDYNKMKNH